MDAFRYYLALLVVMGVPGAIAFWFSIHPFVEFWRRAGLRQAYIFHISLLLLAAAAVFRWRSTLLQTDFGAQPVLIAAALVIYVLAFAVALQRRKGLSKQQLVGLPELAPGRSDNRLITAGIYSRVRHPRYLELSLFLLGHALVSNYLAVYVALGVWLAALPALPVIVGMEEKELRRRFGKQHESYCARVPRLIPKL
jgi:protein-S-isoprenylcysteine O-methyltransferase Ste14